MNRLVFQKTMVFAVIACGIATLNSGSIAHAQASPPSAPPAGTAAAVPAAATFGLVDIDNVAQTSKAFLKDKEDLTAFVAKLRTINNQLSSGSGLYLSNDQMRELAGLYEKDQPTDAEKKRIAELEAIGDSRKGEASRLDNTAAPTDVQRKRFTELNAMHQQGEQNLTALGQDFENRLHAREDDLTKKALAAIKEAIAVVAKQKGLSVVFDSKFALYAQVDITADVAKQVNK